MRLRCPNDASFMVSTASSLTIQVFWDMTLCSCFPIFQRNMVPSPSTAEGYRKKNKETHYSRTPHPLKIKALHSLEHCEKLSWYCRVNPRRPGSCSQFIWHTTVCRSEFLLLSTYWLSVSKTPVPQASQGLITIYLLMQRCKVQWWSTGAGRGWGGSISFLLWEKNSYESYKPKHKFSNEGGSFGYWLQIQYRIFYLECLGWSFLDKEVFSNLEHHT
jgi:hypothetical protein